MITDQRVVFPNDLGGISILIPAPRWSGSIHELAAKDVPVGKPYLIINKADNGGDN